MTDTQAPPGWYQDAASNRMRWWDGAAWTETYAPVTAPSNRAAVTALILGLVAIPGILLSVPAIVLGLCAIIFGIVGAARASRLKRGTVSAVFGAWLGGFALIAGTVVGALFLGNAATTFSGLPNAAPVQVLPTSSEVVYSVTGDGLANITYMTVSGGNIGQESANQASLPFSKRLELESGFLQYSSLTLIAGGDENTTTISCKIVKDGEVIAEQTSTGAFAMVSCASY